MRLPFRLHLKALPLRALLWLLAAAVVPAAVQADDTLRLRIAWGGESTTQWVGQVSLSEGQLREVDLLSRERDAPGSIWLQDGTVHIAQPRRRRFDGFDITAAAPLDATLRLEFKASDDETSTVVTAKLSELMQRAKRSTIGLAGTTLLVHRAADDALRIDLEQDSLIFDAGEKLQFTVEPVIAGAKAGSSLDIATKLYRGRRAEQIAATSKRTSIASGGATKVPVELQLPDREGVYTVEIAARTPPGNRTPFWGSTEGGTLASRRFQIVVLGNTQLDSYIAAGWQTLLEIDPANPSWWNRLPEWTRLDRLHLGKTSQQVGEPFRSINLDGKAYAELPRNQAAKVKWRAYPLPSARAGLPHVVEVDLPRSAAQTIAINVYEPDAAGNLIRNGPGSGIEVSDWPALEASKATHTIRYVFWPRTNTPQLVIQNASQQQSARYGTVRLRVALPTETQSTTGNRLVAARFSWRGFLNRCGSQAEDAKGQPAIDDWVAFYEASVRLAELLELNGYNAALVNAFHDGGAAFDLGDYSSTPQLNSSRVASGTNDLPEVQPLELMMRVFSRRGLRLMPTLNFSSTLPTVEQKLRGGEYKTLKAYPLWTDLQNRPRTRVQTGSIEGPPHYRLSHRDVQSEVNTVVARLLGQVGHYPAFAGVGIELGSDSYLAMPASHYGMTPDQLTKFAVASAMPRKEFEALRRAPSKLLESPSLRNAWNEYRAKGATAFFAQLTAKVRKKNRNRQLILLTDELLQNSEPEVRPSHTSGLSLDELYTQHGLSLKELYKVDGLGAMPPLYSAVGVPLADAAVSMELDRLADDYLSSRAASRQPTFIAAKAADVALAPLSGGGAAVPRATLMEQAGSGQNQLLVEALRQDAGGVLIVGSSEGYVAANQTAATLLRLAQQTPAAPALSTTDGTSQNVIEEQLITVRAYQSVDSTVALALNRSPWPISATITLDVPTRTTGQRLAERGAGEAVAYTAGKHAWTTTVEPYSATALQLANGSVSVAGVRMSVSPGIEQALAERYKQLEQRDLNPDQLELYLPAPNPSFEEVDFAGNAIGWKSDSGVSTGSPALDGERAAKFISTSGLADMSTVPFQSPATGQLAITAYIKAIELSDDAVLRLVIEEATGNSSPRFVELSAERLLRDKNNREWNGYQFGVEDLPLDTSAQIQVRLELKGIGEVWIDNLKFYDLVYPLRIYEAESEFQVLALVNHLKQIRTALDEERYSDCLAMLDSYWSQFMLQHLPEIEAPQPAEQQLAPSNPSSQQQPTPRLTDRVRDLFRF